METSKKTKLRILIISPLPPPASGIGTWTSMVSKGLSNYPSIDLRIIDSSVRWRGALDLVLYKRLIGGSVHALIVSLKSLYSLITFRPDTVHLNTSGSLSCARDFLILLFSRLLGIRIVIQYHVGFLPNLASKNCLHWKFILTNMRLASAVLVLGQRTVDLIGAKVKKASLTHLPNPIDIGRYNRKNAHPAPEVLEVLFLGHVFDGKGVFELVEACSTLDSRKFNLSVIGDISLRDRSRIFEIAGDGAETWLKVMGERPHSYCQEALDSTDILALPSKGLFEAFPYVILEAMASSVAVISTNLGAIPEMLGIESDAPAGLLVNAGDVPSLRAALNSLLLDHEFTKRLGSNGFSRVQTLYRSEVVVDRLVRLWFEDCDM